MRSPYEPDEETFYKATERFSEAEKRYIAKYGEHSLDRVILGDPLSLNAESYDQDTEILERAIKSGKPLEQIPQEMWDGMVF